MLRKVHSDSGFLLPNPASFRLHEALSFEYIDCFLEVGQKLGRWIDVGTGLASAERRLTMLLAVRKEVNL